MEINTANPGPKLAEGSRDFHVRRGLFIAVSVTALLALLGCLLLGLLYAATATGMVAANAGLLKRVAELESRADELENECTRLWIAGDIYNTGVTDSFYTNNAVFYSDDVVDLDIDVQGDLEKQYEGEGVFSANPTDLKAELYELVLCFQQSYEGAMTGTMTAFSGLEVRIFINGYELATYKGGKVTLAERYE